MVGFTTNPSRSVSEWVDALMDSWESYDRIANTAASGIDEETSAAICDAIDKGAVDADPMILTNAILRECRQHVADWKVLVAAGAAVSIPDSVHRSTIHRLADEVRHEPGMTFLTLEGYDRPGWRVRAKPIPGLRQSRIEFALWTGPRNLDEVYNGTEDAEVKDPVLRTMRASTLTVVCEWVPKTPGRPVERRVFQVGGGSPVADGAKSGEA